MTYPTANQRRREFREAGAAALEFALVLPSILVLLCAVAIFGSAYYSKQLLYDIAGETARTCVMKNLGSLDNYAHCVQTIGTYLTTGVGGIHSGVCLDQQVLFESNMALVSATTSAYYQHVGVNLLALEVTASCAWTYAKGTTGILPQPLAVPVNLTAVTSMPFIYDLSPL